MFEHAYTHTFTHRVAENRHQKTDGHAQTCRNTRCKESLREDKEIVSHSSHIHTYIERQTSLAHVPSLLNLLYKYLHTRTHCKR